MCFRTHFFLGSSSFWKIILPGDTLAFRSVRGHVKLETFFGAPAQWWPKVWKNLWLHRCIVNVAPVQAVLIGY